MMHWFSNYGMGGFGMIYMMVFWALVVVGLFYLIKIIFDAIGTKSKDQSPEEILKRRYAAGEIDKEEYEERVEVLKK